MKTPNRKLSANGIIETHPFKPFVPKDIKYLIIGSFPGKGQTEKTISEADWFYGAKRNTFWKIIEHVYQTELSTTSAKQELFTSLRLGIADIILKAVRKENTNSDSNLQIIEYNGKAIKQILESSNIQTIFFTSKFVQTIFMKFFPEVKNIIALPSPSPRNARMSLTAKVDVYKKLLPKCR